MVETTAKQFPAKYSATVIAALRDVLDAHVPHGSLICDPFGGVGGIHALSPTWRTVAVEIEPEWAEIGAAAGTTVCGDSRHLASLIGPHSMDAIVTSPAYGNRMADQYLGDAKRSRRYTYATALGRRLSPWSGAAYPFGKLYKVIHEDVWGQCATVLDPGGILVLNASDFIRKNEIVEVVQWHRDALGAVGFEMVEERPVSTPRNRDVAIASQARVPVEYVQVYRLST